MDTILLKIRVVELNVIRNKTIMASVYIVMQL